MAHVQKRNGRWQARYRGPDGLERSKRFSRKVDAEHWLDTNGADIVRGSWVDPRPAGCHSRTTPTSGSMGEPT
jgi:hypothetical protein